MDIGFPALRELRTVRIAGESSPFPIWAMDVGERFQNVLPILEILSAPGMSWMVSPESVQSVIWSWVRVSMVREPSGLVMSGWLRASVRNSASFSAFRASWMVVLDVCFWEMSQVVMRRSAGVGG